MGNLRASRLPPKNLCDARCHPPAKEVLSSGFQVLQVPSCGLFLVSDFFYSYPAQEGSKTLSILAKWSTWHPDKESFSG
jgi:hypothetical protein